MAVIANTKKLVIFPAATDLTSKKSTTLAAADEIVTVQDIIDTVQADGAAAVKQSAGVAIGGGPWATPTWFNPTADAGIMTAWRAAIKTAFNQLFLDPGDDIDVVKRVNIHLVFSFTNAAPIVAPFIMGERVMPTLGSYVIQRYADVPAGTYYEGIESNITVTRTAGVVTTDWDALFYLEIAGASIDSIDVALSVTD